MESKDNDPIIDSQKVTDEKKVVKTKLNESMNNTETPPTSESDRNQFKKIKTRKRFDIA